MLKKMFLARLEPVVTRFGPCKIQKCLVNVMHWAQNGRKMRQKHIFPKVILDCVGCTNKGNEPA